MTDAQDRSLFLQVRVSPVYRESCGAVSVRVYAPMWLVNKTGLPLVFRQEGYSVEAAGQDVEHEVGIVFVSFECSINVSYNAFHCSGCEDGVASYVLFHGEGGGQPINHHEGWERTAHRYTLCQCTVMVFKLEHLPLSSLSDGKATWCRHFYIQLGANVRRLRVSPRDGHRPEWVYTVGVEVRAGNGRYRNTVIVTLAPRYLKNNIIRQYILYNHVFIYQLFFRFQLYNQSSHRMVFSQSCYAATVADPAAEATHLVALPQSSLAFHWPRLDRDQVNCPSFSFETYSI